MTSDPIMSEITAAIAVLQGGDRSGGRRRLEAVWSRIADAPEPFHECVLSHYMADAQDVLADELAWDIRSLDAALRCTAEVQFDRQAFSIAAFMPSIYLNLSDDYFRLGDFARARAHLASAREVIGVLADDGYGKLIRGGLERLEKKLGEQNTTPLS
jgi:hypothetical protein